MLKEKVTELMDRYESGDENLTATDVLSELETIMDEYGDNSDTDVYLSDAIRQFVWTKHQAKRYGGRCDDGSDEFIRDVERIIDYDGNKVTEYCPHCDEYVNLEPELKVQTCPHCGKRIPTCSMCRAVDENDGKNYCSNCCLCKQAELENKENEA